ncbi:MAG: MFS transporter [Acidihalobacter sp.]|uniref:MFS transporter n=1 Tax=Acidihalobacter sp. TaxID=1872108 RepID=UPI00307F17C3
MQDNEVGEGRGAHGIQEAYADRRWLTLTTLCVAVLVAQIDTSVVNLAVQPIGRYFDAEVGTLQWVVDAYNLVYAALLLTGGLLADLYGRRRIFMAGAALFSVASVLCALAPTATLLVAARALAGLGAALLLPASLAIIRVVWPEPAVRAKVLGIWAASNGVALAIGPTVGGVLIDGFGWRSIFWVAVPLGLAALSLAPVVIPESSHRQGRRFDVAGQVLGAAALASLAVAAIESRRAPGIATVAALVALSASALFLRIEKAHGAAALVPLDMFSQPAFRGAMAATAGMTFGMYGVLFLLPLTWQAEGWLGPVGAGVALMPMALTFVAVSPFSGALLLRVGERAMTAGGVAIIGLGLLLIAVTTPAASLPAAEAGLVMTGLGMGLATGPLMGVAVAAVPVARSGTASALINVARMVGATLGVAVLGAVFALWRNALQGLEAAMFLGGAVQLAGAAWAWNSLVAAGHRRA